MCLGDFYHFFCGPTEDSWLFDYDSLWSTFDVPNQATMDEVSMFFQQRFDEDDIPPRYDEEPSVTEDDPLPDLVDQAVNDDVPIVDAVHVSPPAFDDDGDPGHEDVSETDEEVYASDEENDLEDNLTNLQGDVEINPVVQPRLTQGLSNENIIGDLKLGAYSKQNSQRPKLLLYTGFYVTKSILVQMFYIASRTQNIQRCYERR